MTIWSKYKWKTFGESIEEAENLACGILEKGLNNEVIEEEKKYSFIAIYAKN